MARTPIAPQQKGHTSTRRIRRTIFGLRHMPHDFLSLPPHHLLHNLLALHLRSVPNLQDVRLNGNLPVAMVSEVRFLLVELLQRVLLHELDL